MNKTCEQCKEHSATVAIQKIKAFYKKHGRTPQYSDFVSDPDLPKHYRIDDLFGTFNNARASAEVPVLVKTSRGWEEKDYREWIPQ